MSLTRSAETIRLERTTGTPLAFALGVVAAIQAFIFVYPRQWTRGLLINDEMWFADLARNLLHGHGFVSDTLYPMLARQTAEFPVAEPFKQVAYPLVTALMWQVTDISHRPMILIAILSFGILVGFSYLLAREVLGSSILGATVAALVACNPSLLAIYTAATPEPLFSALVVILLWLLARPTLPRIALSGACHAVMLLTKSIGIIYVPLVALYVLAQPTGRSGRSLAAYVGVFVATLGAAWIVLPAGSVQILSASGNYSVQFLFETDRYDILGPYMDLDGVEPLDYILAHPVEMATKYLRVFSRTKVVLEALAGPALGGLFFPGLLLSVLSLLYGATRTVRTYYSDGFGPTPKTFLRCATRGPLVLLMLFMVGALCCLLWAILFRVRYVAHVYPLMLIIILSEAGRLRPLAAEMSSRTKQALLAAAVAYGVLYPSAFALWESYRRPAAFLGRGLPIRIVDYRDVAAAVTDHVPRTGVVVSDLAHEIGWLTGNPTIHFPLSEDQLRTLVDRFDVQALIPRPDAPREWPWIAEAFYPVDAQGLRLWIRREG